MKLTGARVALGATSAERFDLEIRRGRVQPLWQLQPLAGLNWIWLAI